MSRQWLAELIGTFWLVVGGCGSAVLAAVGPLGVSLAFGLSVEALGQLWLFWLAPLVAAALAGQFHAAVFESSEAAGGVDERAARARAA